MTAATKTHKLRVTLALKWLKGGQYEAQVSVEIIDSCYHPGALSVGLPSGVVVLPEVEPLTFTFTRDEGKACADVVRTVDKTITATSSAGKQKVTAFAVVNGAVAGSDTKPFPRR
jgi:hypothetical protein